MKRSLTDSPGPAWTRLLTILAASAAIAGCSVAPRVGNIEEVAFAELAGEYRKIDLADFESQVNHRLRNHPFDMGEKDRLTIKIDGSDASVTHTSYSNVFTQKPSVIAAEIVERMIRGTVVEHNYEACGRQPLISGGGEGAGDFWIVLDYLYFEQDLRATRKTSAIIYSGSSTDFDGEVGNFFSESELKVGATLTDCKTGRKYTVTREVIHAEATIDKSIYLFSKDRGVVWVDTEKHSPGINSAAEMAARAAIGGVFMMYLDENPPGAVEAPRRRECVEPDAPEISGIQLYLQRRGFLQGGAAGIDGRLGPATRAALDRYVREQLDGDGFDCITRTLREHFRSAIAQTAVPPTPESSEPPVIERPQIVGSGPVRRNLDGLSVHLNSARVRLGSTIELLFEADRAGSLSLWNRGSDGAVTRIYPPHTRTLAVRAGDNWLRALTASGKPGREALYVVWTRAMSVHALAESYPDPQAFFDNLRKDTGHSISDVLIEFDLELVAR